MRIKQENVLETLEHGKYLGNARYITIIIIIPKSSSARRICQVALVVKNPPANAGDVRDLGQSLGWEDPLEEGMAIHSSILA